MLASVRRSLLRPPTRAFLSTTTPPLASSTDAEKPPGTLADVLNTVEDTAAPARNSKNRKMFYPGNILRPNDLSPEKCQNSRGANRSTRIAPPAPEARYKDIFRQLNIDPVDFTLNPHVLSTYISEMGKIYGRNITGLTCRSQRRLGKAIRRARMIGIIPQLSRPSKQSLFALRRHTHPQ
ncbi:hypothetical protein AGABI2DRAFT_191766 [Agaricus bisporus var. bisporus H97]|uniref:hypothetical protein n=1 Tax=Agaricus bisporus var. bisporus (strain H97 / ATCC MYA-4626 / FGSC 10389) TaxID=936046 RepID=UPI00029F7B9B|nr:hypothetical protein AGABI2DRAFT_191766 [Agaricus bisporus var. bisporus H97]EKV48126.1 hypothetical protein AGABI2DRAFT_191766 [Agaricus bisporus var. bisporus H97]